jgi:hypothetical protein
MQVFLIGNSFRSSVMKEDGHIATMASHRLLCHVICYGTEYDLLLLEVLLVSDAALTNSFKIAV